MHLLVFLLLLVNGRRSRLQRRDLNHCDREAEVLKAIANGLAVRCRNRNEEIMINGLKLLHETRQQESREVLRTKKQSAWSKIESAQGMVTLAKNFRYPTCSHCFGTILTPYVEFLQLNQTWTSNKRKEVGPRPSLKTSTVSC